MPRIQPETETGFTLIELSVVLVIVGLIVGGIMVGQDLIAAARERATITQIQKYDADVDSFRAKYVGYPGDLLYKQAAGYGLSATTSGGVGMGDGNGLIQDGSTGSGGNQDTPVGEILLFWRQLSDAKMIDGGYGSDITVATAQGPTTINPAIDFPTAKIGRNSYVIVGSDSTIGANCFGILGFLVNGVTGGPVGTAAYFGERLPAFTPIEEYNIDQKMDDGYPLTGIVQARGWGNGDILATQNFSINWPDWNATPISAACVIGGAWPFNPLSQVLYNTVAASGGNTPNCELRFQFN